MISSRMTRASLLTVSEIAEELRLSTRTVRRLIAEGELPGVRVGRSIRVACGDIEAFVDRHRVEWKPYGT